MPAKPYFDRIILIAVLLLMIIGIAMVFSSSALVAQKLGKKITYFCVKQLIWAILGLLLMLFFMFIDYKKLKSKTVNYGVLGISLCLLVYVLFGSGDIKRWVRLGSFSLQPSELAKIGVVLFLAFTLQHKEIPLSPKSLVSVILIVCLVIGLILIEPDLGTVLLITLVFVTMLFVLGISRKLIISMVIVGVILLIFALELYSYRMERIMAWWCQIVGKEPSNRNISDALFQLEQAKIAVGSGGIKGLGFGNSLQKLYYLPQPHNDFIFAIISEELGLIGALGIWLLFFIIFVRGALIAKSFSDRYGSYLAFGITLLLIYQSLINMSVVLGLFPTKGIPLPFVSYGGSSLLSSLCCIGLLLNLSQNVNKT